MSPLLTLTLLHCVRGGLPLLIKKNVRDIDALLTIKNKTILFQALGTYFFNAIIILGKLAFGLK